ncbi:MAG: hypothetical protein GY810_10425 [Aureispira sp.]|nr:hypothetical protein [Aureispira sp.]
MPKELDHIRRVETAKEFRSRLGNLLQKGQEYRTLEVDKNDEKEVLADLKDKKHQKEQEIAKSIDPIKNNIESLTQKKKELEDKLKTDISSKEKKAAKSEISKIDKQISKLQKEIVKLNTKHLASVEKEIGKKSGDIDKITKKQEKLGVKVSDLELLKEYSGPGPYIVCVDRATVRFVKVTCKEDFLDKFKIDLTKILSFKLVKENIFDAWETTLQVSAKLKVAPGELLGVVEAKATTKLDLPKKVSVELEAFANAYGHMTASLSGIMIEVGANAEAKVAINLGKYVSFSAKAYASAKAGVYASFLGLAAAAEAEAGLEASGTVKSAEFWGGCSLELSAKVAGYGKAEAKAAVGLNQDGSFGVGAMAGVSVGVKGSLEGTFKYKGDTVGSIGAEVDVAIELASVGAVASINLKPGSTENNDGELMRVFSFGAEVGVALEFGAKLSVTGTIKIGQKFIDKGVDALKEAIKVALKKLLGDELYKKVKAIKQEVDHYAKKVTDVKKQLKENTINYLHKGMVKIQLDHNKAVKLEFSRHNGKLEKYKKQVTDLMAQLEAKGLKDLDKKKEELTEEEKAKIDQIIQDAINKVESEELKKLISGRARKDIFKDLQKYAEKYDRRIKKFNDYINKEYNVYSEKIEKHYLQAVTTINEFQVLVSANDKDKSKTRKKLNSEVEKLNKLVDTFNKIIEEKDKLLASQNIHGDSDALPGGDTTEVERVINVTFDYLRNRIHGLMDKIDDLREDLK